MIEWSGGNGKLSETKKSGVHKQHETLMIILQATEFRDPTFTWSSFKAVFKRMFNKSVQQTVQGTNGRRLL